MSADRPLPTLDDVAAKSGVSTATVSRALNFPDQVAEKTRTRVMTVIRELGYSPNFGARAMAAKRTKTIGAVIPTMENAMFARGLQAFEEELQRLGYTFLVASSHYSAEREEVQIRSLVARGAEGLLLIGHARDPAIYDFLAAQKVPALVSWAVDSHAPMPSVGFDNVEAMKVLTRAVLAQGHDRLAMISATVAGNDRAAGRVRGVRDAMQDAGRSPDTLELIETTYSMASGASAFGTLMNRSPRPTAILCGNDVLAAGALSAAQRMGLRVPQDVSVTGFDDMELAQFVQPPLTTVRVPHSEMGRLAAQALVGMLTNGGFADTLSLPADLRIRQSLGPAPRNSG